MENLMTGTAALRALGRNPKQAATVRQLKKLGIEPLAERKTGKGKTVFVRRTDVNAAIKRLQQKPATPTHPALAALRRIRDEINLVLGETA